ncbi:glycoside hydrolase family 2 protein [Okibacterium fritillariae]|uniref:Glycosyl hydrolases family 2 n=1 Tax=Okibacterium fritillariae TaxID=123320 RepID=A0A1T5IE63_9MICO|nr:glycoside hydrolase family 2 TIM barrel-domain containing protein [Okibacterium fritillariae]SKC37449.1 Glycosyl hydrolases family 2 [Okibacterium fritillariae]
MTLVTDRHHLDASAFDRSPIPRPEYPRPDRDRSDRWLSLNGEWDFRSIDGDATIIVPFAWETEASGIARTWLERATYTRSLTVPEEWAGDRVVLSFGAVWHEAAVLIDGVLVGTHTGGYTSFEFDVTDHVAVGHSAELTVEVSAPADKREIVHGKQRSIPRDDYDGVSFTPSSGIWQSVWLEARGRTYASSVTLRGDSLTGIDVSVSVAGDRPDEATVSARILDDGAAGGDTVNVGRASDGSFSARLDLDEPRLWSPEDPHLYRVEITTEDGASTDAVVVTTGLRRIEVRGEQLFLNDERLYVRGVLDQGYWPTSGLTAPDDDALLRDLELARGFGFNLVRKHLKFEEPRWLHAADEMGMLVWAEPACPSRFTPAAARAFEEQIAPMVERDGNHPSIVIWGLYNEEWGLDWDIPGSPERAAAAVAAYDTLAAIDHTRPIVENSGWSHVKTDLVDWHYYEPDPATWAQSVADLATGVRHDFPVKLGPDFVVDKSLYGTRQNTPMGVPILNSEFGEGFTSLERAWHVRWQTQELRRHDRFAGYVYTELADVEHESAGLVDVDRRAKDAGGLDPADSNADTVLIVDLIPRCAGADMPVPTQPFELGIRLSHHGRQTITGRVHATWVEAGRSFASFMSGSPSVASTGSAGSGASASINVSSAVEGDAEASLFSSAPLSARPFEVSSPGTLTVRPPREAARLLVWFTDVDGTVRARTFIDAAEVEQPNRRGART